MTLSRSQLARTHDYDLVPIQRCKSVEAAKAMQAYLERSRRIAQALGKKSAETQRRNRERRERA
jgi:hypothetical protein